MDRILVNAGTLRECFKNLANNRNSSASIRILGKLYCEMSYVAAKYVA